MKMTARALSQKRSCLRSLCQKLTTSTLSSGLLRRGARRSSLADRVDLRLPITFIYVLWSTLLPWGEAGYCMRPGASDLSFCRSVNYKVYVMEENPAADYWRSLDRKAEIMQDDWNKLDGCGVENAPQGWCQNYACAISFPKCNVFGDAPLGVCRQTCIDCFDTCTPDRPILAPSLFFGAEGNTWAEAYKGMAYDAYKKSYRCEADHRLVDGKTVGLLFSGKECTSSGGRLMPWTVITCALWGLAITALATSSS